MNRDGILFNTLMHCIDPSQPNFGKLIDFLYDFHITDQRLLEKICRSVDQAGTTALQHAVRARNMDDSQNSFWSVVIGLLVVCVANHYALDSSERDLNTNLFSDEVHGCLAFVENIFSSSCNRSLTDDLLHITVSQQHKFKKIFVERYFVTHLHAKNFSPFTCLHLMEEGDLEEKLIEFIENSHILYCLNQLVSEGHSNKKTLLEVACRRFDLEESGLASWYLSALKVANRLSTRLLNESYLQLFNYYFEQLSLKKKYILASLVAIPANSKLFANVVNHPSFKSILEYKDVLDSACKMPGVPLTSMAYLSHNSPEATKLLRSTSFDTLDMDVFVTILYDNLSNFRKGSIEIFNATDQNGMTAFGNVAKSIASSSFFVDAENLCRADQCAIMASLLYGCGARLIKYAPPDSDITVDSFFTRQCLLFIVQIISHSSEYTSVIDKFPQDIQNKIGALVEFIVKSFITQSFVARATKSLTDAAKIRKECFKQYEYQELVFWYIISVYAKHKAFYKGSQDKPFMAFYQWLMADQAGERIKFATCLKLYFPHSIRYLSELEKDPFLFNLINYEKVMEESERARVALLEQDAATDTPFVAELVQNTVKKLRKKKSKKPAKKAITETKIDLCSQLDAQSIEKPDQCASTVVTTSSNLASGQLHIATQIRFEELARDSDAIFNEPLTQDMLYRCALIFWHLHNFSVAQGFDSRLDQFLLEIEFQLIRDQSFSYGLISDEIDLNQIINSYSVRLITLISSQMNPQGQGRVHAQCKKFCNALIRLLKPDESQHQRVVLSIEPLVAMLPAIDIPRQLYVVGSTCSYLLEKTVLPSSPVALTSGDIDLALVVSLDAAEFPYFFEYLSTVFAENCAPFRLYFTRLFERTEEGRLFGSLKFSSEDVQIDLTVYCEKDLVLHTRRIDSLKSFSYNLTEREFVLTRQNLMLFLDRQRAFAPAAFESPYTLAYVLRELSKKQLIDLFALTEATVRLIHQTKENPSARLCLQTAIGLCLVKYVYSTQSNLFLFLKHEGYLRLLGDYADLAQDHEVLCEKILCRVNNQDEKDQNWLPLVYFSLIAIGDISCLAKGLSPFAFLPKRIQHQIAWLAPQLMIAEGVEDHCVILLERIRKDLSQSAYRFFKPVGLPHPSPAYPSWVLTP